MINFKLLPKTPGVYQFFNKRDEIIYIGKAKNLQKRVAQYFKVGSHKSAYFKSLITKVKHIVTKTEAEALLLEINLIKNYQPKFNFVFKDDKSYPYICVLYHENNLVITTKRAKQARAKNCFGPYPHGFKVFKLTRILQEVYKLKKCKSKEESRCLYYQLGQCLHLKGIAKKKYNQKCAKSIIEFLKGDITKIKAFIKNKINNFVNLKEYEMAAKYKQIWDKISEYNTSQMIDSSVNENADYIGSFFNQNKKIMALFITHVRQGKIISTFSRKYYVIDQPENTLKNFIISFYNFNPHPQVVYLEKYNFAFSLSKSLDLVIKTPHIGKKKALLNNACLNANEFLKTQSINLEEDLISQEWIRLGYILKIEDFYNLEMYDASHISGSSYVGAKIEFVYGQYNSSQTRKYDLSQLNKANDNAAIEIMLTKRFKHNQKPPDLIIVDGGISQLNTAWKTLQKLKISCQLIGLVKNKRHQTSHILLKSKQVIKLTNPPFKLLLSKIQQKIHDVAINYHRFKKQKLIFNSWLNNLPGVGKITINKLIKHFGSSRFIKQASLKQLQEVVSPKIAQIIFQNKDL